MNCSKSKAIVSLGASLVVSAGLASTTQAAVDVDGYTWDYAYTGDALPDASAPAWSTGGAGSATVSSGELTVDTLATDGRYYEINDGTAWNPESGSTTWIQARIKVNEQSTIGVSPNDSRFATGIYMGGAGQSFSINLGTYNDGSGVKTGVFDRIHINLVEIDVFQYHTYRVALDPSGDSYDLYIDDFNTPVYSGVLDNDGASMYFGDGSGNVRGSATYDYIAWNNSTAPVAVPEPGALSLIGLASIAMFRRRNR